MIIGAGALNLFLFTAAGHPDDVFLVNHTISRGATIASSDLSSLAVVSGQKLDAFSTTQRSAVVGKVATTDLPKGSVLTPASVAETLPIPAGQALVGLALKPAQLPARPLTAGDHLHIVFVTGDTIGDPANGFDPTSTISAVVSDMTASEESGLSVVDVYVAQTVAADLTSRAAAGTVAIYLTSDKG